MADEDINNPEVSNLIRDFVLSRIGSAIDSYKASSQFAHPGLKGEVREIFLRDIISPLLPPDIICGSGLIIDRYGSQSSQTDVVLYARDVIPSVIFTDRSGIYPVESCFYALEVKSRVSRDEIINARDKAIKLRSLQNLYHPLQIDKNNRQYFGPASTIPRSVLFAFSSDLKSNAEKEFLRFRSIVDAAPAHTISGPPIRIFCLVGCGYWYYSTHIIDGAYREGWYFVESDKNYSEVAALIGGMFNTMAKNKFQRYSLPFGLYLIPNQPVRPAD